MAAALSLPGYGFLVPIALSGAVFALISFLLARKLRQRPESVMARFKINKMETEREIRIFMYANSLLAVSLLFYAFAGYRGSGYLMTLAEHLMVLVSLAPAYVFWRWYERL